jgi:two-component system nitrate/nitrite sensor histidine kinase NarX
LHDRSAGELPELTIAQQKTFYWIIQESLTNIRRHSQANSVKLLIKYVDNSLSIYVNDNGKGFNPDQVMKTLPLGHMGLQGMKERAELLDGCLDIDSKPGKGTSIKCTVNFSNN